MPLRHARKGVFDDHVGFGERLGDVAALEVHLHGNIVRFILVHERRAVFHRFFGIKHARKRLPIDFDQIDGLLGDIGIDCGDGRDLFADIARFADRKYVLICKERSPGAFDRILGSNDRAHAGKLRRFTGIDAADPRMRIRASQHSANQRAGKLNVGDKFRFAGNLVETFHTLNALSDDGVFF